MLLGEDLLENDYISSFPKTDQMGVVRFQNLPEATQEKFVKCFDEELVPDWNFRGMTVETLRHWYANRALLKFWVKNKHLRNR
jgi:hypothetical protein